MLVSNIQRALSLLREGGIGVMPTDTVYGLVARAADRSAVERLYRLKERERKPGTVVAASIEQLAELGVPRRHLDQVGRWWPGPLSIEIPLEHNLDYLHQTTGRQAFRVVGDKDFRHILEEIGPLVTSSANRPGEPGATSLQQARKYFGDSVDFYVDGGDLSGRLPSTVIGISTEGLVSVFREGAMKLDKIG